MVYISKYEIDYWAECIAKLREYEDRITISKSLSDRLYCGKCTHDEEVELLRLIEDAIKNLKNHNKHIVIHLPFWIESILHGGNANKESYKVEHTSYKRFLSHSPKGKLTNLKTHT